MDLVPFNKERNMEIRKGKIPSLPEKETKLSLGDLLNSLKGTTA